MKTHLEIYFKIINSEYIFTYTPLLFKYFKHYRLVIGYRNQLPKKYHKLKYP